MLGGQEQEEQKEQEEQLDTFIHGYNKELGTAWRKEKNSKKALPEQRS